MLSKERVDAFRRDGFLVAGDAVDAKQLAGLAAAGDAGEVALHEPVERHDPPVVGMSAEHQVDAGARRVLMVSRYHGRAIRRIGAGSGA